MQGQNVSGIGGKAIFAMTALVALVIGGVAACGKVAVHVGASDIVVVQHPISGDLDVHAQPGLYYQSFGSVTRYSKSTQFWFSAAKDQGEDRDQSIQVRFNDGGHANLSGSLRFDVPLDVEAVRKLHTKYGSQAAIEHQLIRTVVEKAIYMSGPLMSSKESYAERRADLISAIEDQIQHGVYKSEAKLEKTIDPLSGQEKTISKVSLLRDEKGTFLRQEPSAIEEFGIRVYNLAINAVTYDKQVEEQIQVQQRAVMQVQTAMAEARQAEQKAITAEKEGQANAAKAKWEQEVVKAKAVTEAEQKREVARLASEAAEYTKQEQIKLGEGEAARKKAVMVADGALEKKLTAYTDVMKAFAAEIGKQRWVPEIQMGVGSGTGGSAVSLIDLLQAKTARDLTLDMSVSGTPAPAGKK